RPHWPVARRINSIAASVGNRFQIGASAKSSVVAIQHADRSRIISFKFAESFSQRFRCRAVNRVANFRAVENDCCNWAVFFYRNWHRPSGKENTEQTEIAEQTEEIRKE